MPFDFSGKTAVVTGGANGIGLAAARALADGGARVWIFDREPAPGFTDGSITVDVTDRASLDAAFDRAGDVDIAVVNAGTAAEEGVLETSPELWDRIIRLNLTGAFHTVQAAGRIMRRRGGGAIVLTASTNSFDGEARLTAYNASKSGLMGLLHTAANELGPHGIRVNAVCPGLIRTRLTDAHFSQPAILRDYFRHIPMGRGGEPGEVAQAIAFLASDLASFITGAHLFVDGGQMASKFSVWNEESATFENGRWRLK